MTSNRKHKHDKEHTRNFFENAPVHSEARLNKSADVVLLGPWRSLAWSLVVC